MPGIEIFSPLPTASIRMSLKAESTASALVLLVSAFSASAATRSLRESATDAPKNDGLVFLPASLRIGIPRVPAAPRCDLQPHHGDGASTRSGNASRYAERGHSTTPSEAR